MADYNNKFMLLALEEAKKAFEISEIPVGCVIVKDNIVISKSHNMRESRGLTTAHAEVIAIEKANEFLNTWRLDDCDMYVTLEPCPMCSGAIIQSRIKNLYYAASDKKTGSHNSILNLFDKFDHKVNVNFGYYKDESKKLLDDFFKKIRNK